MAPTPERYIEIQQALIDKGYLEGPATGVWGAESVAALKKFQQDQNLEPSGKLDSLSLITLGLGPRRDPAGSPGIVGSPSSKNTILREPQ
jgi:peptidoglycan hydrolase-like protein with peptidoglycan-binding domain